MNTAKNVKKNTGFKSIELIEQKEREQAEKEKALLQGAKTNIIDNKVDTSTPKVDTVVNKPILPSNPVLVENEEEMRFGLKIKTSLHTDVKILSAKDKTTKTMNDWIILAIEEKKERDQNK